MRMKSFRIGDRSMAKAVERLDDRSYDVEEQCAKAPEYSLRNTRVNEATRTFTWDATRGTVGEMVSITHIVIVQRFTRTAPSWYVLTLTAYMPQGRLAQCSILQAYHYISLIMNKIGNKHY